MNRDQLVADLKTAEGLRRVAYDDATGLPIRPGTTVRGHATIGYGHNLEVPVPLPVLDTLLDLDITAVCADLDRELPWWTERTDSQQRALVELAFSMGVHGLLACPLFLMRLRAGQTHLAGCELATAKWARDVGPTRAQRVIAQIQA